MRSVKQDLLWLRFVGDGFIAVAAVVTMWVSMTHIFDLIFHFHPIFLGVAAGWSLRGVEAPMRGAAPSILVVVFLSAVGAIVGTAIIESAGGPVDPDAFTAGVTSLGVAAGIFFLHRPWARRTSGARSR